MAHLYQWINCEQLVLRDTHTDTLYYFIRRHVVASTKETFQHTPNSQKHHLTLSECLSVSLCQSLSVTISYSESRKNKNYLFMENCKFGSNSH